MPNILIDYKILANFNCVKGKENNTSIDKLKLKNNLRIDKSIDKKTSTKIRQDLNNIKKLKKRQIIEKIKRTRIREIRPLSNKARTGKKIFLPKTEVLRIKIKIFKLNNKRMKKTTIDYLMLVYLQRKRALVNNLVRAVHITHCQLLIIHRSAHFLIQNSTQPFVIAERVLANYLNKSQCPQQTLKK